MNSRFHAANRRRAERSALRSGDLNLIPLVDVLVSILFFSLLTYTGATGLLTAFDLRLPPVLVTPEEAQSMGPDRQLDLLLAVRIQGDRLLVEHTGEGGFHQEVEADSPEGLRSFQQLMEEIRVQYPSNNDVLVIPDDATSYEYLVQVLERLRLADFEAISLGSRARATQIAAAGG